VTTAIIKDYTYDEYSARWLVLWSNGQKTELSGYERGWKDRLASLWDSGASVEIFGTPYRYPWEPLEHDDALEARKAAFANSINGTGNPST
jgi:hypothetical protein